MMVHSTQMGLGQDKVTAALSQTPPSLPLSPSTQQSGELPTGVYIWRRLLARCIDLLFLTPFSLTLYIVVHVPIEIFKTVIGFNPSYWSYLISISFNLFIGHVIFIVSLMLYEAISLALFRTTAGKAMLGIRVSAIDGSPPKFIQSLRRVERLLRSHAYLIGFPILTWPFIAASFAKIKDEGFAIWDEYAGTRIEFRNIGPFRLFFALVIGAIIFLTFLVTDRIKKDETKRAFMLNATSAAIADFANNNPPPIVYNIDKYADWETISVPGICTFQIPSTMEIKAGKFKEVSDQHLARIYEITEERHRVVAQQAGLNALSDMARAKYARIIVETQIATPGEFERLGDPLPLSVEEVRRIDATIKLGIDKEINQTTAAGTNAKIISWDGTRIVRVNGIDCILTTYRRAINSAPPVIVRVYRFMNNDRIHIVSISYRETERELWANDLDKAVSTFHFVTQ